MEEIKIRTVFSSELATVHKIEKISFKNPYPLPFIESLYFWNPKAFLVAVKKEEVVGYIIASTQTDVGLIISIAVIPSEKRKGIGKSLITAIIHFLKDIGMNSVRLEVRRSNINAQKFYEALGFEFTHTVHLYYRNEDAFVYFKFLN
ncbi:ribosomal protein S18-alanine N-acetyltransferase [Candidatus Bathyarchaeota archaeon]|jgi:ribosomal-protein-alanine N-acetyltransferase|nr:ribosomal protein S18-alanine N-acetyltransferase [Candidatus Bathyarchaeota archaeon]